MSFHQGVKGTTENSPLERYRQWCLMVDLCVDAISAKKNCTVRAWSWYKVGQRASAAQHALTEQVL